MCDTCSAVSDIFLNSGYTWPPDTARNVFEDMATAYDQHHIVDGTSIHDAVMTEFERRHNLGNTAVLFIRRTHTGDW